MIKAYLKYRKDKTVQCKVLDSITELSVIEFTMSFDKYRDLCISKDSEGISFMNIPIGINNNRMIIITLNNMDRLMTILEFSIMDRENINRIQILYENIIDVSL